MSDLPKCRLCGCDPWFDEDGDYGHPAGSDCVLASAFYMTEQEWNKLMTQQQAEPVVHTFYVLHDATEGQKYIKKDVDDGCLAIFEREEDARRAKRRHPGTEYKRVDYYTAPIQTAWQPIETAPDGLHLRAAWVYNVPNHDWMIEVHSGYVDDDGMFVNQYGDTYGIAPNGYFGWQPLPPAPGGSDE